MKDDFDEIVVLNQIINADHRQPLPQTADILLSCLKPRARLKRRFCVQTNAADPNIVIVSAAAVGWFGSILLLFQAFHRFFSYTRPPDIMLFINTHTSTLRKEICPPQIFLSRPPPHLNTYTALFRLCKPDQLSGCPYYNILRYANLRSM